MRLAEGRKILSRRLAELYEADKPDLVTVVLNSDGFADLLERGEFLGRIQDQDNTVIKLVRTAKADATSTAARLDKLEARQQQLTAIVLQRRDQVASVKNQLIGTRVGYAQTRAGKARRAEQGPHRAQVAGGPIWTSSRRSPTRCRRSSKAAPACRSGRSRAAAAASSGRSTARSPRRSASAAPGRPATRAWTSRVPTGTPIRAADGGRVAIAGWVGGYGNYTCIQHTASLSTCYGHQSVLKVHVGQQVTQGQIIGLSGSTGHSTGPHLHFEVRVNGAVTNPMNYL